MTVGSEWKHIVMFSLPIMAGNLLQQLYNTVDGIVVGNYVSESALAAVGNCAILATVFLAVAMGLSGGAGIMIAQYFGAKDEGNMRSACSTALILLLVLGVVFTVLGIAFARPLCERLMDISDPEVLDMSATYFAIYASGLIFQFCYNIVAFVLRGVGDSKATLYFLMVSAALNVVLDLYFVISLGWGVSGVAIATVISQAACTIVSIIYMFKKYPIFRFKRNEFVFEAEKCKLCLRLGIPATLQQCIISFGSVFIQRLINSFGQVTMSAYTVGMRVESYVFIPIFSFNIGLGTFTGQNMGAGKIDRIKRAWKSVSVFAVGVCICISATTYIFAVPLSKLFGVSGQTLIQSVEYIHYLSKFFVIFALYMVAGGVLHGAGDVIYSSCCTLSSLLVRVVCSYLLVYGFGFGYNAAWLCIPVGWLCAMVLAYIRYFGGQWMKKGLVKRDDLAAWEA